MSLFEDASLIVTPNGRKAGKIYALKPFDGSGDLTVVRATTATEVNASGVIVDVASNVSRFDYTNSSCPSILVEPQRTNLVLRSEEFSNIIWSKINTNVTEDSTISPDGTTNADTFTLVSSTSRVIQSLTLGAGSYTVSVYLKITSGTPNLRFQINIDGTSTDFSITGLSSVWQRYTATFTATTSVTNFAIRGLGSVGQVAVWGAQLEAGSNATSYIPTVSSAVTRNADIISKTGLSGITTITETFEDGSTNVISGSPTSYTMSEGRIKNVIAI